MSTHICSLLTGKHQFANFIWLHMRDSSFKVWHDPLWVKPHVRLLIFGNWHNWIWIFHYFDHFIMATQKFKMARKSTKKFSFTGSCITWRIISLWMHPFNRSNARRPLISPPLSQCPASHWWVGLGENRYPWWRWVEDPFQTKLLHLQVRGIRLSRRSVRGEKWVRKWNWSNLMWRRQSEIMSTKVAKCLSKGCHNTALVILPDSKRAEIQCSTGRPRKDGMSKPYSSHIQYTGV